MEDFVLAVDEINLDGRCVKEVVDVAGNCGSCCSPAFGGDSSCVIILRASKRTAGLSTTGSLQIGSVDC